MALPFLEQVSQGLEDFFRGQRSRNTPRALTDFVPKARDALKLPASLLRRASGEQELVSPVQDVPQPSGEVPVGTLEDFITPTPTQAPNFVPETPADLEDILMQAATEDIDPLLLSALAAQESSFDPQAVSPVGAQGMFQFTPQTVDELVRLGFNEGQAIDPFDPGQSAPAAAFYLQSLLDRFGGDLELALAAYNAGPGTVQQAGGVPEIPETQNFVNSILGQVGR